MHLFDAYCTACGTLMKHPALLLLEELIAIPSVNPVFDPTGTGEAEIANYIEARAQRAGLAVTRQEVFPGRDNLVIQLDLGKAKTLLFESHMDTVPFGAMPDATVPTYRDGLLYGRGSCDTKATMAGMLHVMEHAAAHPEEYGCNLMLCAAVDEEHGAVGIARFVELGYSIDGAVVGEPTELQIVAAHKGVARFAIETFGVAAHSSVPHEGKSAIYAMFEVLRFIKEQYEKEIESLIHPLCGAATIVVGTIKGGRQINIVPDSCIVEIDRRVIPGESSRAVIDDFTAKLAAYMAPLGLEFKIHDLMVDPALNTSHDAEVVLLAQQAATKLGLGTTIAGVPYGSDGSKLENVGVPTIVYGAGSIAQAHTAHEYVPVNEVELAVQFYGELARSFGR